MQCVYYGIYTIVVAAMYRSTDEFSARVAGCCMFMDSCFCLVCGWCILYLYVDCLECWWKRCLCGLSGALPVIPRPPT